MNDSMRTIVSPLRGSYEFTVYLQLSGLLVCAMNEGGSEGANGVLIEGAPERWGAPRRGGGS